MATGGPPDKLDEGHQRAALLIASGLFTDKEVAERLGYHPNRLYIVKQSPLFQALVKSYRERIAERDMDAAVRAVMDDVHENVEFLKSVRAGAIDDPKVGRLQLRASEILFDRQMPKQRQVAVDQSVTVRIDSRTRDRLDAVSAEDDAIDVTPPKADDASG